MSDALKEIILGDIKPLRTGKVRSIYDLGDKFLFVATDRISAYDCILPNPIPEKGKVLNQLSTFWFDFLKDICGNHYISDEINDFPDELKSYSDILTGRSMLVKKAKVLPVECIVRGSISGSAWKEYLKNNTVHGTKMAEGLKESEEFPEPLFTPSTKADEGHDINISYEEMLEITGKDVGEKLKNISINIFKKSRELMRSKGIILADTKFEFGIDENGEIILIDEVLTPDSSRFWPLDKFEAGRSQESYDKQFVRDYLSSLDWDKTPPAPELPEEIISNTRKKYLEIYEIITDKKLK